MRLIGADTESRVAGLEELTGKVNYFIGNDPTKWRTNISTYAKALYQNLYPGVNLIYYGRRGQLEYDFVVAPGADPRAIRLSFEGVERLEVDAQGDLVLRIASGEVRLRKPLIYQDTDGARQTISGGYVLLEPQTSEPETRNPSSWFSGGFL